MNFPRHACEYAERLAAHCAPFRLQLEPDAREFDDADEFPVDPFGETGDAAGVPGLKQRFEDRVLVMASKLADKRGGTMRLIHPVDEVMDILEMTGLTEVFSIER